jgi:hypothetical protein
VEIKCSTYVQYFIMYTVDQFSSIFRSGWPDRVNFCPLELLWVVFLNDRSSANLRDIFSQCISYVLVLTKMNRATFWATYSQAHLVTLMPIDFHIANAISVKRFVIFVGEEVFCFRLQWSESQAIYCLSPIEILILDRVCLCWSSKHFWQKPCKKSRWSPP